MFAELLGRSCFSFLHGASQPEELVERAHELGLGAVALCDRDGLYGLVRAHARALEVEQRFIVGAELGVAASASAPAGFWDKCRFGLELSSEPRKASGASEQAVVAFLVRNEDGYANLCRLITLAHADHPKGESALELRWLSEHAKGLVAIVPAPKHPTAAGAPSPALLGMVHEVFGESAFLAAYRHLDKWDEARHALVERWSERYGLQVLASARPLFHHRSRKSLADVLYCIRNGMTLDRAGAELSANGEAHLRSALQMQKLFRDRPDWVERSGEVAAESKFSLSELKYRFPCSLPPGESADGVLRRLTFEGLKSRYPDGVPGRVVEQIEKELALIAGLEVAPYFLSTWEVVEMARRRRILCQGRGSAANSAVCYALGITAVDPARSNLLFERFLSAERREPPDIDVDFEHERREEVIQEIYQRYGRDRAAMVSEVISYRGKSALREVGKVFGFSLEQVDRLSSAITHWDTAEVSERRLEEYGFDASDSRIRQTVMLARTLEGFPRHLSIHVGGFVLSAEPLSRVAPVEPARMRDRTVVPWDKDDLETLGFFKIDVLGLGMLTAIRKTLELMHESGPSGEPREESSFDPLQALTRIPPEDPSVYAAIGRADTVGVFQIESRAQMAMLPRLRPKCFYDLVIEVAIVRPGPIQGGMVHPYLRRRNGEEAVRSPHPDLTPILKRTLGVPLFQEQVMQIAIVGAGYSGGEADQLRRDMAAWKKTGRLMRHRQKLLDGFREKGISPEFGAALFEQIKGFGDYGFPESHAASFALLVYVSAWQKAHFPAHFACALINSQPMGFYSPSTIVRDAQKHGVEVRDVDVERSFWDCSLEPVGEKCRAAGKHPNAHRALALRLGMRLVKGLGESAALRVEAARTKGPFRSVEDLARRARLQRDDVEALAEAGALESLAPGRRQALWQARAPRVEGLFAGHDTAEPEVHLPSLSAGAQLLLDYGRKGLSVEDHPMRHWRSRLDRHGVATASTLEGLPQGRRVTVAGLVLSRQQPGTASGVVFMTLEDESGFLNVILYRRIFEQYRLVARHATLLLVQGKVERDRPPVEIPKSRLEEPTAVIHVVARHLERLDVPGRGIQSISRDFH
jgi:error-prone DNA polymerase